MFSFFKKKEPPKPTRAQIIAEAQANARAAAEAIGENTLAKIREHLMKSENSEFHKAIEKIRAMDQNRIADNIRATFRDDK